MDWIKKNPAQFSLAMVALLVIGATALLYTNVSAFDSNFDGIRGTSVSSAPVAQLNTDAIDTARKAIESPVKWVPADTSGRLLVSKLYVLKDGRLQTTVGTMFHPPVPNDWFKNYGLDPLSSTILKDDPDADGFNTLEEWNGLDTVSHLDNSGARVNGADGQPLPDDSTNPTKADSHPAYHTKLSLVRVVYIPFRLRLMSYDLPSKDGKPKKPSDTTVQINTIDRGNRTLFLPVGEDIPGTKFKTESFQQKEVPDKDGTTKDVSELTIVNKETGEKVVLPLKTIVDSPDSHAIFRYKWVKPGGQPTPDFSKRRTETFGLLPEPDKVFKVTEIKGQEVTIELPGGTKKTLTQTP